jgi:hypothetical protein
MTLLAVTLATGQPQILAEVLTPILEVTHTDDS